MASAVMNSHTRSPTFEERRLLWTIQLSDQTQFAWGCQMAADCLRTAVLESSAVEALNAAEAGFSISSKAEGLHNAPSYLKAAWMDALEQKSAAEIVEFVGRQRDNLYCLAGGRELGVNTLAWDLALMYAKTWADAELVLAARIEDDGVGGFGDVSDPFADSCEIADEMVVVPCISRRKAPPAALVLVDDHAEWMPGCKAVHVVVPGTPADGADVFSECSTCSTGTPCSLRSPWQALAEEEEAIYVDAECEYDEEGGVMLPASPAWWSVPSSPSEMAGMKTASRSANFMWPELMRSNMPSHWKSFDFQESDEIAVVE